MTKTAKQDAAKASALASEARAAATEPAATRAEAAPEEAEAETTVEPDETAGATAGEATAQDLDETKRKFRAALERKQQTRADGQGQGTRDGNKINGVHGPAASRRNFRRKSG